jgi:hypothetical protein
LASPETRKFAWDATTAAGATSDQNPSAVLLFSLLLTAFADTTGLPTVTDRGKKRSTIALRCVPLHFFLRISGSFFFEGGGAHWKISTSSTKAGRMKSGGSSTQTAGC